MVGKIICALYGILYALPFLYIGFFRKDDIVPISFWSGDELKINNVKDYNIHMSSLYKRYGFILLVCSSLCFMNTYIGLISLFICSILGLFLIYRKYKQYLKKYA